MLIGAVITFSVSRNYYMRASQDLVKEADRLKHLNTLILRSLEENDLANLARNEKGEITGLKILLSAHMTATSKMTATLS
jgi:hypothetical protein